MAKPILSTPPVSGDDARILVESLKGHASREVIARRIERSRERLAQSSNSGGAPSALLTARHYELV